MPLPKLLVLDRNDLTGLTLSSIQSALPDADVKVASFDGGYIRTALKNCNDITLVVESGVMLNTSRFDVPGDDVLSRYQLAVSRAHVFADHPHHVNLYGLMGITPDKSLIDLTVFLINPSTWSDMPISDREAVSRARKLYMPRYMNHRSDPVVPEAMGAWPALQYGMLGMQAVVNNYIPQFLSGTASPAEMYGYCMDYALSHLEALSGHTKDRVHALARKTQIAAARLRSGLVSATN